MTSNPHDFAYSWMVSDVFNSGEDRTDRTGVGTRSMFGRMLSFNMEDGTFPAITLKRLAWKSVVAELLGFIRGYDSAAQFRELGCKVWDQNANENAQWLANPNRKGEDDLGRVYGVQWRRWTTVNPNPDHGYVQQKSDTDQLLHLLARLEHNPDCRRLIVNAWNPGELDHMALPPCHMMFQVSVRNRGDLKCLDMNMYQRSADSVLGVPFNIASYALLLHILCLCVSYDLHPGRLNMMFGDYHLYLNHLDAAKEMLGRTPFAPPSLRINAPEPESASLTGLRPKRYMQILRWLEREAKVEDFELVGYQSHPAIKVEMAV